MRLLIAVLLLTIAGCSRYTHVDNSSSTFYTEAESAKVGYESWPLFISIHDSNKNLAKLRPLPGTAYIWTTSKVFKLTFKGSSFENGTSSIPKNDIADTITFKFYGSDSEPDSAAPLEPGLYNLSVQFNGSSGVYTLCGSFRIITETKGIQSSDLH